MSTLKLKLILKNLVIVRFLNAWTRKNAVSSMVMRCIRDRGFRDVIQIFKHKILRPRRTLFLSATAVYKSHNDSFSCDQGISDEELQTLLLELENAETLAKSTLYCTGCGARLVIDRKQDGIRYCMCKEPQKGSEGSDGWAPYMEAQDVIIWRKEYKPGGLYAYKVYGRYPEVSASDFAAVQIDGAYRRVWDNAVAALAVVQRDARGVPGQAVLHWEVLWPRLFANRDYVYIRRHKEYDIVTQKKVDKPLTYGENVHSNAKRKSMETYENSDAKSGVNSDVKSAMDSDVNNKVYIIVSKSCEHPEVPETKHAIRVAEYWSHMVVKTIDGSEKPGMEFVLTYYDEPAVGGMPGGVAAWASSRAAPVYLERMRRAAQEYRAWVAGRSPQELPDFIPFEPDRVSQKQAVRIQEQDMETSKEGPEMENGVTTRDQSSQTDECLIRNTIVDDDKVENNESLSENEDKKDRKETEVKKDEAETPKNEKRETPVLEEDSNRVEEEENNGGWWRYLYPFYYFV